MTASLVHTPLRTVRRSLALVAGGLALALACGGVQAAPGGHGGGGGGWHGGGGGGGWHGGGGGWHGGGYGYRGGWGWDPLWGVGLGLGIGLAASPLYYDQPNYVVVSPPAYYPPATTYYTPAPVYATPAPAAPASADPIFYPRAGQTAAQTEADRQACNRWATTQNNAMNDGSVFQRATFACMDGRGYTAR
jgi:hypothetical protein